MLDEFPLGEPEGDSGSADDYFTVVISTPHGTVWNVQGIKMLMFEALTEYNRSHHSYVAFSGWVRVESDRLLPCHCSICQEHRSQ